MSSGNDGFGLLTDPSAAESPAAIHEVARGAHVLDGSPADFAPLLRRLGDARVVMLGEASHGTHEFYRIRNEITKRLIVEHRFSAVAIEGDWPDAARVHAFVQGMDTADGDATEALAGFRRFPQWMWRNADVLDFVGWLRQHNEGLPAESARVGFYGLDLYSLHASIDAVIDYLQVVDPEAALRARERYACFDHVGAEPEVYGQATALGLSASCEHEVVQQLVELQQRRVYESSAPGGHGAAALFGAQQNAHVVRDAERYYRALFDQRANSWNLRDRHMMETLVRLEQYLARGNGPPKIVVWAHNSHVGDARATDRTRYGEFNIGQLAREYLGAAVRLVGFTTFDGTVTAASDWGAAASRMDVRPALQGSVEWLMHATGHRACYIEPTTSAALYDVLRQPRLARAIGVIYRPQTERQSHYFTVSLARQFDAVLHLDHTRAVEPLEREGLSDHHELPETFPSSL